jgi:maltose alpha-D-glucosyltransferase/alpha-amylase
VAYFGDGDECHIEFHNPLMPRMFMALRMEQRYPIIDILAQTPDIPETAQWALFLRNHDELTLEMVTDEERDYMYRVYAADPQARINLGIRRRLAPLLGNNRRRIELMNGLLFSLPGTPVIYYGDEIGMGDNVYLGDRNGVRTPMQWSSDRNAGFSRADRQRLYFPVITDAEYHYEAVNVDAQLSNPQSLLWWMRRIIALRKRHPAFGRGSLRFLHPGNRRILAFLREHEDETLLVVANLSRYAQWTELPLAEFEGRVPVELFGAIEFPPIGAAPYLISLGPHSFLWFRLAPDPVAAEPESGTDERLPELTWRGDLEALMRRRGDALASVLLRWIVAQRWYRGGTSIVASARIVGATPIAAAPPTTIATIEVLYRHEEPVTYVLPLAVVPATEASSPVEQEATPRERGETLPAGAIAHLVSGNHRHVLVDGSQVPAVFDGLLGIVAGRRKVSGSTGELVGRRRDGLPSRDREGRRLHATPMGGRLAMSNSSAAFDDQLVLKLYRVLEEGPNPDLEVGTFLAERGFAHVPRLLGSIEVSRPRGAATLAMVQAFVPHESNLWETMRAAVETFLHDAEASGEAPVTDGHDLSLLELSRSEVAEQAHRLIGPPLATAHLLGRRVGEMHHVLASAPPSDKAFAPEPLSPFNTRALYQSVRARVRGAFELLEARQAALPERDRAAAAAVLAATPRVEALLGRLRHLHCDGQRIRIHGDLHLGHVLDTGDDVVFIDFEGDTARPLSERRLRWPALGDLASLVRSFHFAAHWPRVERELLGGETMPPDHLASWSTFWFRWLSAACIAGYRDATAGAAFIPSDDRAWSVIFGCLLVSRASDELTSRLGSRSDWLGIPLAGLDELLGPDEDVGL